MLSARKAKWFFALFLFAMFAIAKAAPTIGDNKAKFVANTVSPISNADSPSIGELKLFSGTNDSALAHIAAELLKPPTDFTSKSVLPPGTKSLPPVPAALFMGLTGFICVTLVRDRKFWLTAIAFILWAGQVGITALPQRCRVCIAHHLNKWWAVSPLPSLGEQASRLRCRLEGTEYICLLHYLEGIPTLRHTPYDIRNTQSCPKPFDFAQDKLRRGDAARDTHYAIHTAFPRLIQTTSYLVIRVRRWRICFSPAFIFESIPRGPPISRLYL